MNHKHEALWMLKNYKLYIMCTLIWYNHTHLTIGSKLILIQNELWVKKCCCSNLKRFLLMFKITKGCHQNFILLHIIILIIHYLFWTKNGSPLACFHPMSCHPSMDELICLPWMKYLQPKDFFKKIQKHIIYMETINKNLNNNFLKKLFCFSTIAIH